jgi:DNA-binding MarR family transcriptional regulator
VPLPTLLSQALVAYTIEFDNETEHLLPHSTSSHGTTDAPGPQPWLVSMVMYCNCMKFVGPDGVQLGEMERLARTRTNLDGMRRWRYIDITPGPTDRNPKRPGARAVIRATAGGRKAQDVWGSMFDVIDGRWRERFGAAAIADLRAALSAIADRADFDLPECLPILGYGLFSADRRGSEASFASRSVAATPEDNAELPLSALLSRVLLAAAIDFEYVSPISLAISSNVLRVLDDAGAALRDLPMLTGVSKEAIAMAVGHLEKNKVVAIEPLPRPARGQRVRLTPRGRLAQNATAQLLANVEDDWSQQFGTDAVRSLRSSLEPLVGDGMAGSPLFAGLTPYPDGWRADVRAPTTLPHFPMVLHRGGYPDGS